MFYAQLEGLKPHGWGRSVYICQWGTFRYRPRYQRTWQDRWMVGDFPSQGGAPPQ